MGGSNHARRGLTLVELLLALAVMSMLAVVIGGLAMAVQTTSEYSDGHGTATQHARVALERIGRAVREATASADAPGFAVVHEVVGGWRFPHTLVVWRPAGAAANPQGPPLVSELVLFCPNPRDPRQLVEITAPGDGRSVPLDARLNQSPYREMIDEIKTSSSSRVVVLSDLLRTASVSEGGSLAPGGSVRGAVRFEQELRPSAAAWQEYRAGRLAWPDLPWPQGIYGSQTGLRQAWLRIELQLMPGPRAVADDETGSQAVPFFGSAALYYEMTR